ncbi:MAG TPA: RNA 2',3'-cyclic phosphodiesterase [Burkholderiaceae bacterium]|nr:RNA 2',3'-cyclic phosphodiesterase [Burkholderiaceae bacterium]
MARRPPASIAPRALRLFVALWPTAAVRHALVERRDAIGWPPGAGVVDDQRLHLTLHFIGNVPQALWPHLLPALRVPLQPIELELDDARQWPHGLVVLPTAAPSAPLLALQRALGSALSTLGLPVEQREFRPHVTLARGAAGAVLPGHAPPLRWRPGGYALVNSDPVAGYRVLARYGERGITLAAVPRTATARSQPTPTPKPR